MITMRTCCSSNRTSKAIINQNFCPYYKKLYGLIKDLNNKGLIDSFWILTHKSDPQF